MRRVAELLVGLYLVAAVASKVLEAAGVTRCHCTAQCWCRKPMLAPFRWVFPYKHA